VGFARRCAIRTKRIGDGKEWVEVTVANQAAIGEEIEAHDATA
jgi:hypothetical protein